MMSGIPTRASVLPTGRGVGPMWERVSAAKERQAPVTRLQGSTTLWADVPRYLRTRCGAAMPTKPSGPAKAVTAAVGWLERHALQDVQLQRFTNSDGLPDRRLVHRFGSKTWARYYDLQTEEPYVCDRDGIPQPSLEYIGYERRNGYGWYGDMSQHIIDDYDAWLKKNSAP